MKSKVRMILLTLLLAIVTVLSGCSQAAPTVWDTVQEETAGQSATTEEAVAGSEFNRLFPDAEGDYDVVFTQEKAGFAEAVLKKEGEDVATLAIFDIVSNPDAATKYADSNDAVAGHPAVTVGDNGFAVLVANRFQVQIRSESDEFTQDDSKSWLETFDLDGLAALAQ